MPKPQRQHRQQHWTEIEDNRLKAIVAGNSAKTDCINKKFLWHQTAKKFNEKLDADIQRSGKQCRERWINSLDPELHNAPLTPADIQYLMEINADEHYRQRWSNIAIVFQQLTRKKKSPNSIKNYFCGSKGQNFFSAYLRGKQNRLRSENEHITMQWRRPIEQYKVPLIQPEPQRPMLSGLLQLGFFSQPLTQPSASVIQPMQSLVSPPASVMSFFSSALESSPSSVIQPMQSSVSSELGCEPVLISSSFSSVIQPMQSSVSSELGCEPAPASISPLFSASEQDLVDKALLDNLSYQSKEPQEAEKENKPYNKTCCNNIPFEPIYFDDDLFHLTSHLQLP